MYARQFKNSFLYLGVGSLAGIWYHSEICEFENVCCNVFICTSWQHKNVVTVQFTFCDHTGFPMLKVDVFAIYHAQQQKKQKVITETMY